MLGDSLELSSSKFQPDNSSNEPLSGRSQIIKNFYETISPFSIEEMGSKMINSMTKLNIAEELLKDYFCYTDINNNHLQGVINILQLKITLQQKIISRKFPEAEKYNTSNDTDVQGLEDKILLFDFVSDTLKEYPDNLIENKLEEVKELNKKNQILKKNIQLLEKNLKQLESLTGFMDYYHA